MINILDIFSWLPEKEMSLDTIERTVLNLYSGNEDEELRLEMTIPDSSSENVIGVTKDLVNEGKKVCYLLRNGEIIAAIGYRN